VTQVLCWSEGEYDWDALKGNAMPKYLVEASYTAEGLKGLIKDKASGRKAVVTQALADLGGKLEGIYFTMGERDVLLVCECPDYASVAALGLAASASGVVRTKITPLLTVEELDDTIAKGVNYRPPGT
jgi:uncharacterized protein with GYD domain